MIGKIKDDTLAVAGSPFTLTAGYFATVADLCALVGVVGSIYRYYGLCFFFEVVDGDSFFFFIAVGRVFTAIANGVSVSWRGQN